MGPADLADEYGCSNGHARNVLSDLLSDGEVARVGRGEYVAPPPEDEDAETDVLAGVPADIRESGAAAEDSEDEQMQADSDSEGNGHREDGPARSEDRAGTGGDQEGSEMPTGDELERQREQVVDEDDEGDESEEIGAEEDGDDSGEGTDEYAGDGPEAVAVETVEDVDGEESGGIPVPVSSTKLVVGVGLALLIVMWWARQQNQKSEESQEEQEQEEEGFIPLVSPNEFA